MLHGIHFCLLWERYSALSPSFQFSVMVGSFSNRRTGFGQPVFSFTGFFMCSFSFLICSKRKAPSTLDQSIELCSPPCNLDQSTLLEVCVGRFLVVISN